MKARQYLAVPFVEKDAAKSLGAKWDPDAKLWYAENGLAKLERWADPDAVASMAKRRMETSPRPKRSKPMPAAHKVHRRLVYQAEMRRGFSTPRTNFSLPDCGCSHVAPWDDCEHVPAFTGIDPDALSHLRAISQEA